MAGSASLLALTIRVSGFRREPPMKAWPAYAVSVRSMVSVSLTALASTMELSAVIVQ